MHAVKTDHMRIGKGGHGFLLIYLFILKKKKRRRLSIALFPAFNFTFKSLSVMKPSPQSHKGFIYENQTPSAITDQEQQPSGRGYQGRTGKAINCQSLHRSTSPIHHYQPPPPNPRLCPQTHVQSSTAFTVRSARTVAGGAQALHKALSFCAPGPQEGVCRGCSVVLMILLKETAHQVYV